jgi:hypothetical protein
MSSLPVYVVCPRIGTMFTFLLLNIANWNLVIVT